MYWNLLRVWVIIGWHLGVGLHVVRTPLLQLYNNSFHCDLFLAIGSVTVLVIVRWLHFMLGRRAGHGAKGMGASRGQRSQQGRVFRNIVLLAAAVTRIRLRIWVAIGRHNFLLAHRTGLLGFGQPWVNTLAVIGW